MLEETALHHTISEAVDPNDEEKIRYQLQMNNVSVGKIHLLVGKPYQPEVQVQVQQVRMLHNDDIPLYKDESPSVKSQSAMAEYDVTLLNDPNAPLNKQVDRKDMSSIH